ncbi:sugar ABC transporter substrate-binding protein [Listeria ivanovii]|uniref:ABC transporter substrate-binding protein n=1 Tax=Listeria ivanovii TaxID=1638 RepID=UPI0030B9F128
MKLKKILLTGMLALIMIGLLSSCGKESSKTEEDTDKTLNLLVEGGGPAFKVANQTAKEFEKATGYKVNIDSVPYSGVYDKLKAEIDSKKATHDVAIIDVLWLPSLAKGLEPVDQVLNEAQMADFLPQLSDSATLKDQLLGLPTWTNSKILLYRKDWFEDSTNKNDFKKQYGYDLKVPSTWKEYKDAAEFFTKDNVYGTSVFGQTGGDSVSSWLDHATQAGAEGLVENDQGKVVLDSQPYVDSLKFLQKIVKDKSVPEDYLSIASSETAELFNNGNLAMQIAWGHFYLSSNEALPGKVGAAPMIAGSSGVGSVPGPWYQVVLKDSKQQKIAKEYLKFMYEKNELYMETLGVAARKSVFEKFADNPKYAHVQAIQTTLNGPQTQNRPQLGKWSFIENEVLSPMLQRVLRGEDAEKELKKAQKEIEEVLAE